jgi:hypothetical protein
LGAFGLGKQPLPVQAYARVRKIGRVTLWS